jgi:hypothetical protein
MQRKESGEYKYYIAPDGNDQWPGTMDKPCASLGGGLAASRAIREDRATKTIIVGAGRYYGVNLALSAQDSGLTIEGAPGGKVFLYGGQPVTGWKKDGDKFWSAAIPGVKEGKLDFRAFVVNGRLAQRARFPGEGFLKHKNEFKVPWMSTTGGGWKRKPTAEELTTMNVNPGDLGDRLETKNAEITVYHQWDESLVGVASVEGDKITFSNPAGHPPGAFGINKYVVWNTAAGMHKPGQWFLDRVNGRVVYWPPEPKDMEKIGAFFPTVETIIRCEGKEGDPVKDITIRGINFSVTGTPLVAGGFGASCFPGALSMGFAGNCLVQDCVFSAVAGYGVKALNSTNIVVDHCLMNDIGSGGIMMSKTGKSTISQNQIKNIGELYPSGIGVFINGSADTIRDNQIENTTYTAIACSGDDHVIENNAIRKYMQALVDGGAIYVTFCKRLVIRGNVAVDDPGSEPHGRHAYYIDEQGENCLLEKNIAFNSPFPLHCHMARENKVRNNVFYSKGAIRMAFPRCERFSMEKNIVSAGSSLLIHKAADALAAMPDNVFFSASGSIAVEVYGPPPDKLYSVQAKMSFKPKEGTLVADPLFIDPAKGNFAFKPGSPALKRGIEPLVMKSKT